MNSNEKRVVALLVIYVVFALALISLIGLVDEFKTVQVGILVMSVISLLGLAIISEERSSL